MNYSTLTQLKILVERVVRPVRASNLRKRKMREELLAHVTAVFDEELARTGNDMSAIERAAARFGVTSELSTELQQTTSAHERLLWWWEGFLFRSGESTLRRATRLSLLMALVFTTMCLSVFIPRHRLHEWPLIPAAPAMVFGTTFLMHWMRQAMCGPTGVRWFALVLVSVVAWLFIPVGTAVLCFAFSGDMRGSLTAFRQMLLPGVLAPLTLIATAPVMAREIRHIEEWAQLKIENEPEF